jgi:osmoprotectant transport system ATP-binding protein
MRKTPEAERNTCQRRGRPTGLAHPVVWKESTVSQPGILEIRNLSYTLGGREILRDVSLNVEEGETVVLLGRSGSGKTTLLKAVNGLIAPTGGSIRFEGRSTAEWNPIQLRRRMGYVIQDAGLFPHWTVEANVALVPRLEGWTPQATSERVDWLLSAVGLAPAEFRGRYPKQLSGGQKQRVGIARALAADPPMLLFDEPFAALDPITRLDLQRLFLELRRSVRKTALFVTHDVREALTVGSRVALLKDGALELALGPREFLAATTSEAKAFLAGLEDNWREANWRQNEH